MLCETDLVCCRAGLQCCSVILVKFDGNFMLYLILFSMMILLNQNHRFDLIIFPHLACCFDLCNSN